MRRYGFRNIFLPGMKSDIDESLSRADVRLIRRLIRETQAYVSRNDDIISIKRGLPMGVIEERPDIDVASADAYTVIFGEVGGPLCGRGVVFAAIRSGDGFEVFPQGAWMS